MRTKDRLAQVLEEAGFKIMANKARKGLYGDYESPLETPCIALVHDLRETGRPDLAKRAMDGEWDGTKEEAESWLATQPKEIQDLTRQIKGKR